MTLLDPQPLAPARISRPRSYVMCRPTWFAVDYAINPWMDPHRPVDRDRALRQWEGLVATYRGLGHTVETIAPLPGHPDMVFAANGALVIGRHAYGSQFVHPQRAAEAGAMSDWLRERGTDIVLAGWGFRTSVEAHAEAAAAIGRPVVSLNLVDPAFYHLDVALAVLGDHDIAYLPEAFSPRSQELLREQFPDALQVSREEALTFGLNLVSDGLNVVLPTEAATLAPCLSERGYRPVLVELDELTKAGGSVKCCTLERHA